MEQWLKGNKIFILTVASAFLLYLWLAARIPYTQDDWIWGTPQGLDYLFHAAVNSRYAGNMVEVSLTRSPGAKTVFMAAVFTAIPAMAGELAARWAAPGRGESAQGLRVVAFLFANIFLLCPPVPVWRQTYGWIAGFSNFVVSGAFLLLYYLCLMGPEPRRRTRLDSALRLALVFALGTVSQLFIENLSLYLCAFTLGVLLLRRRRRRALGARLWAMLAGNVLGLALMFSSDIYDSLWHSGSAVGGLRTLSFSWSDGPAAILKGFARRYYARFIPAMIHDNSHLAAAISLALCFQRLHPAANGRLRPDWRLALAGIELLFFLYYTWCYSAAHYGLFTAITGRLRQSGLIPVIDLAYIAAATVQILLGGALSGSQRRWLTVLWCSPFLLMLPLLMVNVDGGRLLFTGNLCFLLCFLFLFCPLWHGWPRWLQAVAILLCLGGCAFSAYHQHKVYSAIHAVTQERMARIALAQTGELSVLSLPAYPFPANMYMWIPDAVESEDAVESFRCFYALPPEVEIRFESAAGVPACQP